MKPKKVLVISLACFRKSWRQKFVLASNNENFIFKFIVPHRWRDYSFPETYEKDETSIDINTGRVAFVGRPGRHFYYTKLAGTMRQFMPDIIHIEHEPESLLTLEVIFLRNLFTSRAKIILRTSRTFQERLRLPKIRALMEKYVYKEIDYAFCINQKSYDFLQQQGYKGPIKIHPNGVDPHLFKLLEVTSLKEKLGLKNSRVIGYAGRFVKEKGIDILIKAAAGLEVNYKILLLGSGPELSHLQTISREKNIDDRLIIKEVVNQEDIPRYINCMNVLVLPSITTRYWEEYFGMALIEALACGIPVIGSTCGEIPNLIGEKRLIFQEGGISDLRMKLTDLFENYEFWKKWAQDKIAGIKDDYSWEVLAQQIIDVYNELITGEG